MNEKPLDVAIEEVRWDDCRGCYPRAAAIRELSTCIEQLQATSSHCAIVCVHDSNMAILEDVANLSNARTCAVLILDIWCAMHHGRVCLTDTDVLPCNVYHNGL